MIATLKLTWAKSINMISSKERNVLCPPLSECTVGGQGSDNWDSWKKGSGGLGLAKGEESLESRDSQMHEGQTKHDRANTSFAQGVLDTERFELFSSWPVKFVSQNVRLSVMVLKKKTGKWGVKNTHPLYCMRDFLFQLKFLSQEKNGHTSNDGQ